MSETQKNVWEGYKGEIIRSGDGIRNLGAVYTFMQAEGNSVGPMSRDAIAGKKWLQNSMYVPRMRRSNLVFDGLINQGSFGRVWKATLENQKSVAVKQFRETIHDIDGVFEMILKERDVLVFLKNTSLPKRVVNIVGAFFETDPFIVMELCMCDLHQVMGKAPARHILRYSVHLFQGLEYIHSRGIWHLDLRPENILVTSSNNAVLANFGKAVVITNPAITEMINFKAASLCWYTDWEGNHERLFSQKSDVWAAACTVYEVETGKKLMKISEYTTDRVCCAQIARYGHRINGKFVALQSLCMESKFGTLLRFMLTPTWVGRPDAASILQSSQLKELCDKYDVNLKKLDDEGHEFSTPANITQQKFSFYADEEVPGLYGSGLAAMYYDELERYGCTETPSHQKPRRDKSDTCDNATLLNKLTQSMHKQNSMTTPVALNVLSGNINKSMESNIDGDDDENVVIEVGRELFDETNAGGFQGRKKNQKGPFEDLSNKSQAAFSSPLPNPSNHECLTESIANLKKPLRIPCLSTKINNAWTKYTPISDGCESDSNERFVGYRKQDNKLFKGLDSKLRKESDSKDMLEQQPFMDEPPMKRERLFSEAAEFRKSLWACPAKKCSFVCSSHRIILSHVKFCKLLIEDTEKTYSSNESDTLQHDQ